MAVPTYSFEPTRTVHVEDSTNSSDIEEHESPPPASRLANTMWCSYAQCSYRALACVVGGRRCVADLTESGPQVDCFSNNFSRF